MLEREMGARHGATTRACIGWLADELAFDLPQDFASLPFTVLLRQPSGDQNA